MSENKPNVPPIKIAFVIDNEVVDVLHTDARLAAIFLSDPVIIDVTEQFENNNPIQVGSSYDPKTKTFKEKE